jgi:hypothetical protein
MEDKSIKVLSNIIDDLEAQISEYEYIYSQQRDDYFLGDHAYLNYIINLNSVTRLKKFVEVYRGKLTDC